MYSAERPIVAALKAGLVEVRERVERRHGMMWRKSQASTRRASRLLDAAPHKISSLRTDDLLIDRLLETLQTSLRHAELHLIFLLLALHRLRRGYAGEPFAARHRLRGSGIDRNSRSGWNRLC
jgi:hypothetical protein